MSAGRLAKATLEELPAQMLGYCHSKKIVPTNDRYSDIMSAQTAGEAAADALVQQGELAAHGKALLKAFVKTT